MTTPRDWLPPCPANGTPAMQRYNKLHRVGYNAMAQRIPASTWEQRQLFGHHYAMAVLRRCAPIAGLDLIGGDRAAFKLQVDHFARRWRA